MVGIFQRRNKNRDSAGSIYSIHSYKSQHPNRFSAYAPSIENQLNSLIVENKDNEEDPAELLQHDFEESTIDNEYYLPSISFKGSIDHSSLSSLAHISYSSDKSDTESQKVSPSIRSNLLEEKNNVRIQDCSLFVERPAIIGKYPNYYIPTPTRVRNYLEKPDAYILRTMQLPYPYRVKEPKLRRLNRTDYNNPLQINTDPFQSNENEKYLSVSPQPSSMNRHSLALGQVDQLLKLNRDKTFDDSYTDFMSEDMKLGSDKYKQIYSRSRKSSVLSGRAVQDILKWIPDQDTEWQDNNDPLQMMEIPDHNSHSRRKRPLHPLDYNP